MNCWLRGNVHIFKNIARRPLPGITICYFHCRSRQLCILYIGIDICNQQISFLSYNNMDNMHFVIFAAEIWSWSFSRQHYLIMSMWRDPQLTSWETAFTNSFSCRSWHKNTFIPSSLLNSGSPSTAECSQNRSLCTVTSRLINTWSRSHLPWLPPSEQSPARSS